MSCTLFLSEPESYEGGELCIHCDTEEEVSIKGRAGDAVLYPSTSLHCVKQIRSGVRHVAVAWFESRVPSAEERSILHDLYLALAEVSASSPDSTAVRALRAGYFNLLRRWAR